MSPGSALHPSLARFPAICIRREIPSSILPTTSTRKFLEWRIGDVESTSNSDILVDRGKIDERTVPQPKAVGSGGKPLKGAAKSSFMAKCLRE